MTSSSTYEPIYADLTDVPIDGPDTYSETEKRKALFGAEARLEGDINDGKEIPHEKRTKLHRIAVANLATYYLSRGAEDPASVRLGDLADSGQRITDYSNEYLNEYDRLVKSIEDSDVGAGAIDHYTYTTGNNDYLG